MKAAWSGWAFAGFSRLAFTQQRQRNQLDLMQPVSFILITMKKKKQLQDTRVAGSIRISEVGMRLFYEFGQSFAFYELQIYSVTEERSAKHLELNIRFAAVSALF